MGQFTPFGQELPDGSTSMHYKFTGKERDAETGLDYFGARYYASSMGRWMSPDWADKPEAVPYSSLDNPQSLNLYGYVGNNPLSKADPDGHDPSDLIFDGQAHTITLVSSDGKTVGSWPAANNVAVHAPAGEGGGYTHGPIQDGTYDINSGDSKGATMHLNGPDNGPYGSQGIIHIKDAKGATGDVVVGDGVHSGRNGPESKTAGCVRTTCEAMTTINKTAKTDPLKTITVKNNKQNVDRWNKAKNTAAETPRPPAKKHGAQ
ncbi:MAG: RHS repeat-associated core domain-containing protein [Acidobacteriaceae bacterium]|nr:RHS repeat-associated core domain-containing protein [Acidobacteriaceae bacterium]